MGLANFTPVPAQRAEVEGAESGVGAECVHVPRRRRAVSVHVRQAKLVKRQCDDHRTTDRAEVRHSV